MKDIICGFMFVVNAFVSRNHVDFLVNHLTLTSSLIISKTKTCNLYGIRLRIRDHGSSGSRLLESWLNLISICASLNLLSQP